MRHDNIVSIRLRRAAAGDFLVSAFLLSLRDVSLAFGGARVLDGVSLSVTRGMRAALTGRNGEGKSTLFKVMAGCIEADSGEIVRAPSLSVAYVPQDALPDSGDGAAKSGGEMRRARLEAAFLSHPDILLLDEPTNHLDFAAIDWLEGMIRRARDSAIFVITHDRRFLRRFATQIFDLDRGELTGWSCDYPTFVRRKAELLADEAVCWEKKSKLLAKEEAWIRRGVKARTTRNEGRVAALEKLRAEFAARRPRPGTATVRLDTADPGGVRVLKVEDVSFSYPGSGRNVISHFTADVLRGERIGIIGANGAGKTTLLNLLTGRTEPDSGRVVRGTNIEMAFLDQMRGELDLEESVAGNIARDRDEVVVGGVRKHVYSYLADFLFSPERARTPVKALSGGERARLMLARLFMNPANLLVMDEPTNDLDVETLELLEEQLLSYSGTLLLVSHDREFLDNVVTSTFVLEGNGQVKCYPGGYEDYARQRAAAPQRSVVTPDVAESAPSAAPAVAARQKKLSYGESRELAALPEKIDALEREIAAIQDDLASRRIYESERLAPAQAELESLVERWAELAEREG